MFDIILSSLPVLDVISSSTDVALGLDVINSSTEVAAGVDMITEAAWDPEATETKIRKFFGIVIWIITGWRLLIEYNKGRTGAAITQVILGAFLGLFIFDSSALKGIMDWMKNILGF